MLTPDPYARSGQRWAEGAELVYAPIAAELVAMSPHPLAGQVALDAGAGTGAVSRALATRGARPVAMDLSLGMLAWNAPARPPGAVADVRALPLATGAVDTAVAAFVLNHLTHPADGLAELARVTRPGGGLLGCVFSNISHNEARDLIDVVARDAGCETPGWYRTLKSDAAPVLGSATAMLAAARSAGLTSIDVDERPVDVGITEPEQLVRYRLGNPLYASWLDTIGPRRADDLARETAEIIRPVMRPYRPVVVFLAARVAAG